MSIAIVATDDDFRRVVENDYLHRFDISFDQSDHVNRIVEWCGEQFGPSAKVYQGANLEFTLARSWFLYAGRMFFRDPDEAMWFRFRWG